MRRFLAAVRGLAGAALGAYGTLRLWTALLFALRDYRPESPLALLGPLLLCPAAYLGYWCLRGPRQRRFACAATWGCAFLALPLAVGPEGPLLRVCFFSALIVFFSRFAGRERFLRYADPAWYRDPRRIAAKYGRGRLSGHWHISPPFGPEVPFSFDAKVGSTVLRVQGDTVRVEPHLRRGWTFSVRDAAGVIQGPGIGHCVPYNAQGQALAVFCLSDHNGELFGQYLRKRGVPFYRLSEIPKTGPLPAEAGDSAKPAKPAPAKASPLGEAAAEYAAEPEEREREEEEIRHTDLSRIVPKDSGDFQLVLRRTIPFGALIGGGLLLGLIVFFAGFPIIALHNGPHVFLELKVLLAAVIVLIAGPWAFAAAKGELFPPSLSVENGRIWLDKGLFPPREIPPEDLGGLRYDRSDECYILFDKQGKTLAKFSTRDGSGSRFLNFLTDHGIRLCRQERNEGT